MRKRGRRGSRSIVILPVIILILVIPPGITLIPVIPGIIIIIPALLIQSTNMRNFPVDTVCFEATSTALTDTCGHNVLNVLPSPRDRG